MPDDNPILQFVYDRITHMCGEIGAHIAENIDDPDIVAAIPFAMFMLENSFRSCVADSILIHPEYFPGLHLTSAFKPHDPAAN